MIYKNTYATIEKKWLSVEKRTLIETLFVSYPQKYICNVDNLSVYIMYNCVGYVSAPVSLEGE